MGTSPLKVVKTNKCFGGTVTKYEHQSSALSCTMRFNVFMPPCHQDNKPVPVLFFLSGLTCTEDNFITKAGALQPLAAKQIALVCPDTSPRGVDIEGQDDSYDFGSGAGFYVDATEPKWAKHYRMYSYVTAELPDLAADHLPLDTKRMALMGHSMGGHGALICALKSPGRYRSVSVFSAICHPSQCSWGTKAFTGYLGPASALSSWAAYDATELIQRYEGPRLPILLDQGDADEFLKSKQLLPDHLISALQDCPNRDQVRLESRVRPGYDHSYYYIQTFVAEHIDFHAQHLLA
ncbi:hypothetical protein H4R35_000277 [Dimargaris xerosporica]|nr:hypothetical protein H4R35_000277 [Dimargaris xerosporica]